MIQTSALPDWITKFRDTSVDEGYRLHGPNLGPSLSRLFQGNKGTYGVDPLPALYQFLNATLDITIKDGISLDVDYTTRFVCGHVGFSERGDPARFVRGPRAGCADIVVVGKHPGHSELTRGWNFVGESAAEMQRAMNEAGIPEFIDDAYITTVCRFAPPPGGKFKQSWINESAWFLWAELYTIRPKMVLLLGSEAIKHFHGKRANVSKCRGSLMPYEMDGPDGVITLNTFGTMHPGASIREPSMRSGLSADLASCSAMMGGTTVKRAETEYESKDCVFRTVDAVRQYVDRMIAEGHTKFVLDCEWAGRSHHRGGKLLSIQISEGVCKGSLIVVNRHPRACAPPPSTYVCDSDGIGAGRFLVITKPYTSKVPATKSETADSDGYSSPGYAVELDADGDVAEGLSVEVLDELTPNFSDEDFAEVVGHLKRLFHRPGVRVGGHNFRSDFPWLKNIGLDLTDQFVRGFDTMLKHHALFEGAEQNLASLTLKYTDMGRYDAELDKWKDRIGKSFVEDRLDGAHKNKDSGFGMIPESVLYLYAIRDVDATFRIDEALDEEYLNCSNERRDMIKGLVNSELRACIGIIEIEEHGLKVDHDRLRELSNKYALKHDDLVDELRKKISWPNFNTRSVFHVRELLFGESLNGKKREDPAKPVRQRPEGAYCCELQPIKSTGRPSMSWDFVIAQKREKEFSPSTDKEVLGILGAADHVADMLRKIRFVDQVCKNFTSVPSIDNETGEVTLGGLEQHIDDDGRIRTRIYQATETGRWSSASPNLQNIPKRREKELQNLFPENDRPSKIRSIFCADDGNVIVSADYMQAELVVLALLSGDDGFMSILSSNDKVPVLVDIETNEPYRWLHHKWVRNVAARSGDIIPAGGVIGEYMERDGQWHIFSTAKPTRVELLKWGRDLHAERAIDGFRLPYCAVTDGPPKAFVERYSSDKRVAAKTVNFGIPYGRSANAIQRELKQDGVQIEVSECQDMINGFYESFPLVRDFLSNCKRCVHAPQYLVTPFWRHRRFRRDFSIDTADAAKNEREACNFPIQSTVADCLNMAVYNCWLLRKRMREEGFPVDYKIVLGVHDALMFEIRASDVGYLVEDGGIVDTCMSMMAQIPKPNTRVCGGLYSKIDSSLFPYALGVDKEIFLRWDEKPSPEALEAVGVPGRYL